MADSTRSEPSTIRSQHPRSRSRGYRVIRFWNGDVMENIGGVLETIRRELDISLSALGGGEGRGEVGDPRRACQPHLTLPIADATGPLPLPPKGRRGPSAVRAVFEKVLIANRGEIALRIHRACREMGIKTVAVHSTADANAMNVRLADETVCIGPPPARDSYLNVAAILSAATITGADAIHPGLGFLAENADFAATVEEHGFTFIGPSAEHIRLMGNKVAAKEAARKLGIPTVPGSAGAVRDVAAAEAAARAIGYPVLIKATAGGGGRGMKVARNAAELARLLPIAQDEAASFFGCGEVYLERHLERPRHIEIQILGDGKGGIIHLGERDCSLQRSHQKMLEETPSPALNCAERERLGALAVAALRELGYRAPARSNSYIRTASSFSSR